jgi:cytochrome P450
MELPAGAVAAPNILLTHRRPDLWPDPERFDPDRFVDSKIEPGRFFPFGGGARTCLGMSFATHEMKIVLARTLLRTRLRLKPRYRARVVRRSITFAPSAGMPVILDDRTPCN